MKLIRKRQIALVMLAATWGVVFTIDPRLATIAVALVLVVVLAVWVLAALGWWP